MPPPSADNTIPVELIASLVCRLGWNNPMTMETRRYWGHFANTMDGQEMLIMIYDNSSTAKINTWHDNCIQPFLSTKFKVRGPMVVFKWFNRNAKNFHVSLNYHITNLQAIKSYVENPVKNDVFLEKAVKDCLKNSNIEKPSKDCVVKNCSCTKAVASNFKNKFLQESTVKSRCHEQLNRLGTIISAMRNTGAYAKSMGLNGVQEVNQNKKTGEFMNPKEAKKEFKKAGKEFEKEFENELQNQCAQQ